MPTKLLIDLSMLRHPHCGLGQVALNYGRWAPYILSQLSAHIPDLQLTLLVPRSHLGSFGSQVSYVEAKPLLRSFPVLFPQYDLWHSIHQLSPFRPTHTTPRLLTIHDLNFLYEKHGAKQQRYLRRLQRECDSASTVCFISQFARSTALQHLKLDGKELHTVYNGVEQTTAGPQERPAAVDPEKPFLLCIGVVKAKKNVHCLLPAMDRLPAYTLIIAGNDSDPYAQALRSGLAEHPNVQMLGTVDDDQRRWLYAHCAALVMPSLYEGFGLPVIEAMQWGKPVICSRMTSLPEIGSRYAFYLPSFEPEAMAQTVRTGIAENDAVRASEEQQYAASFNYSHHLEEYWKIISKIICPCNK